MRRASSAPNASKPVFPGVDMTCSGRMGSFWPLVQLDGCSEVDAVSDLGYRCAEPVPVYDGAVGVPARALVEAAGTRVVLENPQHGLGVVVAAQTRQRLL